MRLYARPFALASCMKVSLKRPVLSEKLVRKAAAKLDCKLHQYQSLEPCCITSGSQALPNTGSLGRVDPLEGLLVELVAFIWFAAQVPNACATSGPFLSRLLCCRHCRSAIASIVSA